MDGQNARLSQKTHNREGVKKLKGLCADEKIVDK
jgi:hypothetical protein